MRFARTDDGCDECESDKFQKFRIKLILESGEKLVRYLVLSFFQVLVASVFCLYILFA